ncbi:glycoside hydrolase family 97 protein [Flavivirga algicola]|uniref:Glycoside hydrolase family 97 protein n=1 Tax=Flavivirga algicola TaxID=2729136 RepID=A0ABX1RXU6_9FLAO|nr:glycoside hydrolase family 97 protein [Flavivirga algicola]NMH88392.1 glycoside hydrolase family 97 protein [Flavivirga algicola]
MKFIKQILTVVICSTLSVGCKEESPQILSPNGDLKLHFSISKNALLITQLFKGDTIIKKSPLGLTINGSDILRDFELKKIEKQNFKETWKPVIGKAKQVENNYNELTFHGISNGKNNIEFNVVLRCYNDGFAYRYNIPKQDGKDSIQINSESTKLAFNSDFTFWGYNGEHHNIGPLIWSKSKDSTYRIPLVTKQNNNTYVGIHEAEIIRYAPFEIKKNTGGDNSVGIKVKETKDELPIKTSWRTFIIGENPGDLVNSNLLVNLNEPCKIEDISWIKPGRAVWDWRVWGYKSNDGFEYGLNTKSHFRFIDFAAENNIQYLLIDADWYGPEFEQNSDPTKAREGINIENCMAYAKSKGIGVILYLNDVGAKKFGLERVLKQFSDWGASGVKYGFMRGSIEKKVRHTRSVVELCAKYKLMVNFHDGPIPPSGDDRTWPNLITKEFCHSQADALRSYYPETIVTTTFVNMMAGAIDNCDGWFDFDNSIERVRVFQEIPGTVAAEVAKLIVVYTGMNIMPDAPEEYLKKNDLFDCIRKMPAQFDSFKVVDGEIGAYIVAARQAGENWFVGALTNRESRELNIELSFLSENENYNVTIYEDAETTHFLDERESYKIRKEVVKKGDNIKLKLAKGGGASLHLEKI